VLQGLYTSLIAIGVVLRYLSMAKSQRSYSLLDNRTLPITFGIGSYLGLALSARSLAKEWPVMPYTAPWWLFFSTSLIAASLAMAKRIYAENQYEKLTELRA
jgi:4-hydroxybenzoate polyprenyltransferase